MFDMNNVYQVAGFYALNGRQPPLVYANAYDYKILTRTMAELKPDYLEEVIRDIAMHPKQQKIFYGLLTTHVVYCVTQILIRFIERTASLCERG